MNIKTPFLIVVMATIALSFSAMTMAGHRHGKQEYFIDKYDRDDDAQVTMDEFTQARLETFELTDENNNDVVDQSEYVNEYANRLDKKIEAERKAQVKQTNTRFDSLDKNKNARIDWQEYQSSGERSFKRYDTNEDLLIDTQDSEPPKYWKQSSKNNKEKAGNKDKKNKKWSAEEIKKMKKKHARRIIRMPSTHNKKGMLSKYDTNGDEVVEYGEFSIKRRTDFDNTDENNDGWLSRDEYMLEYTNRVDVAIEKTRKKELKQAKVRFGVLDDDKSEEMTFDEYQLSGNKMFERMDVNQDGVVSAADPEPKHHHCHKGDKKGGKKHGGKHSYKDCKDHDGKKYSHKHKSDKAKPVDKVS